jgi:maltoporin
VRPAYALSEQFKLVTELGHDQVEAPGGTRKLSKFTFAPTWSPKGPGILGASRGAFVLHVRHLERGGETCGQPTGERFGVV